MVPVMNSGIYRIDLGNGWFYIGSAINLNRRKNQHLQKLKNKKHPNKKMQNCWNKYQVFEFSILFFCQIQELLLEEQFFIDLHFSNPKNANLSPTAGSTLGHKCSIESRKKMSDSQKGRVQSAETRKKVSVAQKSRKRSALSAEHRAKISSSKKGKTLSIEHRKKLSARKIGCTLSDEHRAKISASKIGRALSAEHRAKISAANKLRHKKVA